MPSSLSWRTSSRTWAVSAGPRAAVGSSMIRIRALKWTARAMAIALPLAAGERLHGGLEVLEARVQAAHDLAGRRLHRRVVERADTRAQLAAEEHVAGRVDVVGEGERLVDRLDPVGLGVARVLDRDRLAVDEDLAAVGRVGARQGPDQRRLAGAVAADEADDLARRAGRRTRPRRRGRRRRRRGCRAARRAGRRWRAGWVSAAGVIVVIAQFLRAQPARRRR